VNQIDNKYSFINQHKDEVDQILAKYPVDFRRSAVMPLLFLAQRERGYVTRAAMAEIAEICGVSSTDVASVAGFYTLYYEKPQGKYHIQVCNDLPCAMRGADEYLKQVCDYLGIKVGETTGDGLFTVEAVKCLAACHRAPMFQEQQGDKLIYHEEQNLEKTVAWIESVRKAHANGTVREEQS
jgi:NADH-quinone oxidoreductase subunit E